MSHGPCGDHNRESPCMIENKCSKRFPRALLAETITGNDGYPLYRRRSVEDNGRKITLKLKNKDVQVDNRWIVPYSPLLSKTFKAHCNVEYCNSVKSIKYVCKYVTKGSDMAVFGIAAPNANDEVSQYQMGRYVSSNEALWRIFSFAIHDRHPAVVHLAVHLENGQRVYFTAANAAQRAERPPEATLTTLNHVWLSRRAILAPKNKDVDDLNLKIQSLIAGQLQSFKSIDSITDPDEVVNYPIEFLNSLDLSGMPPHNLQLNVGSVIIMLRNLSQPKLCNGTRLTIKKLMNNVIEATILKGKFEGEDVLIPRIPLISTDLPFQFKRVQFPVRLAFAMTINKSQGQSLEVCGINLEFPCFSHGQLYVACSRVGKPSALFVFAPDGEIKDIVHYQALR